MQKVSIWINWKKKTIRMQEKKQIWPQNRNSRENGQLIVARKNAMKKIIFTYCQLIHRFTPLFFVYASFFITDSETLAHSYLKLHLACDHLSAPLHIKLEHFPHNFSRYALIFPISEKKKTTPTHLRYWEFNWLRSVFQAFIRINVRYY